MAVGREWARVGAGAGERRIWVGTVGAGAGAGGWVVFGLVGVGAHVGVWGVGIVRC